MPVVSYTKTSLHGGGYLVVWAGLAPGDTGQPFQTAFFASLSAQSLGTFGGTTLILEGANRQDEPTEDAHYSPLGTPGGQIAHLTQSSIESIGPLPLWVRPRLAGGVGSSVDVRIRVSNLIGFRRDL